MTHHPAPEAIREALPADAHMELCATLVEGDVICQGALHHSPRPLWVHVVVLDDGQAVHLCGTCRDLLETLRLIQEPSWRVLRCFGNPVRALLKTGGAS